MEEIQQKLTHLIRSQRFNPLLLDELEQKARSLFTAQQGIETLESAQWNHLVSALEKARLDSGEWIVHTEQALFQLNAIIEKQKEK